MSTLRCLAAACAASALLMGAAAQAADVQQRTIKLSVITSLDTPLGVGATTFAGIVGEKSGGKLQVKVFGDGTLGGEQQMVSLLQGGTMEATIVLPAALSGLDKSFAILDLPFVFDSEEQAASVLDGPAGEMLMSGLPDKGLVGLGFMELGFRHYTNSKRAITRVEDFAGLKLRAFQNPVYIDLTAALGANPLPLSFTELYTALETRTVDGQENSFATIETTKIDEVQKHLAPTRHVYAAQLILFGKKFWDRLSPDEQDILRAAARQAIDVQRQAARALEGGARASLKAKGMEFSDIAPQEMARLRERVAPVVDKHSAALPRELKEVFFREVEKHRPARP